MHCYMCKYLYVCSNTDGFLMHLKTSQELSVKCKLGCELYRTFNCLEFTFAEGGPKLTRGPVLAAKIGLGGPIFCYRPIYLANG